MRELVLILGVVAVIGLFIFASGFSASVEGEITGGQSSVALGAVLFLGAVFLAGFLGTRK